MVPRGTIGIGKKRISEALSRRNGALGDSGNAVHPAFVASISATNFHTGEFMCCLRRSFLQEPMPMDGCAFFWTLNGIVNCNLDGVTPVDGKCEA